MKITSTNDGGVILTLSAEEVGAIFKASVQTQLFEESKSLCENIYKGFRDNTREFIDELRKRYDTTWIDLKSESFEEIRHKHRILNYGQNFRILQRRGGLISDQRGKRMSRVRLLW
jgi:hypothetical protein